MDRQSKNIFNWVDFHCHLELYDDIDVAFQQPEKIRTATLAVTNTPKSFLKNKQKAKNNPYIRVALGLHPQIVHERWREIALFERLIEETRYIGEIGLDASQNFNASMDIQEKTFRKILQICAKKRDKILSIHSVRAATKVMNYLEQYFCDGRGKAVMHWFSGSMEEAKRAINLGCYFSVNEQMVYSDRGIQLLSVMPLDRLLTETDGPFIRSGGKPLSPGQVSETVSRLAHIKGLSIEKMRLQILSNLREMVT